MAESPPKTNDTASADTAPPPPPAVRPNAMIIGAAKCGTTSLFTYLAQHPQVFTPRPPAPKEPYFFGKDLEPGMDWVVRDPAKYRAMFDGADAYPVALEATALYFYSQDAPGEMRAFNPDLKLVMMLRDPVRYIYSLHRHFVRSLNEPEADLEKALAMEDDRVAGRLRHQATYFPQGLHYQHQAYLGQHAQRWIDTFGREKIAFWLLDDLSADPARVYAEACRYLGVDDTHAPDFTPQNVEATKSKVRNRFVRRFMADKAWLRRIARNIPKGPRHFVDGMVAKALKSNVDTRAPMSEALCDRLREQYRDDVLQLSEITGRDLVAEWWE